MGAWLALNTAGRPADSDTLQAALEPHASRDLELTVVSDEGALLAAVNTFATRRLDPDTHYLTAYNGETWKGGFDLPFLRSACLRNDVSWPFGDLAYADMMETIQRFNTGDVSDLAGVYEVLVGENSCDPFAESGAAVQAFEAGEWEPLLQHNLADIQRTRELAVLAGRFVPRSDFSMKNLGPPRQ
jgi:hypothetical protein